MKRFLRGVLVTATLSFALLLSFSIFDTPNASAETSERTPVKIPLAKEKSSKIVSPTFVNDFRSRKVNVSISYGWSGYRRVSDNISTYGISGGSISSTKTTTFGTEVSGDIYGLGISLSGSVSNQIGYTLNVGPNRVVYLGYRVYYKIEKGTRQYYDLATGKVISSNSYTVKFPQYGQYGLLNY